MKYQFGFVPTLRVRKDHLKKGEGKRQTPGTFVRGLVAFALQKK
jgi:hypothetical protein